MEAIAHNLPALKQQRDRAQKRGFSLIEAAFVLAVVGAVIGTIWVSAAAVYENYKVSKTVSDLELIAKNVQGLISIRDSEAIGDGVVITSALKDAGVFPKDWLYIGGSLKHPFGGIVASQNYAGAPNPPFFNIQFLSIPRSVCIKLVVRVSSIASKNDGTGFSRPSLGEIQVNYPTWHTQTFPVDTAQAETACTSATNNSIYFYFGYTRIN